MPAVSTLEAAHVITITAWTAVEKMHQGHVARLRHGFGNEQFNGPKRRTLKRSQTMKAKTGLASPVLVLRIHMQPTSASATLFQSQVSVEELLLMLHGEWNSE